MAATIFKNLNPNDPKTKGEKFLLDFFEYDTRFEDWTVFEQPHINSMKPDFVLLNPKRGVIIIEVKDWNLNSDVYEEEGYVRGTDGNSYEKNPIKQVEHYKNGILKSELSSSVYLAEQFEDYYGCVETVVYFHGASEQQVSNFCGKHNGHTKLWTTQDIEHMKNTNQRLKAAQYTYALAKESSKFNKSNLLENIVAELSKHLQYSDYNFERRKPFVLTTQQKTLAKLSPGNMRILSGVAGSGKSLILVEKSVLALKANKRVLILTYNITLRHYLRDLCSQQFGSEEDRKKLRKDLTLTNFHDFLKTFMIEHGIEMELDEDDDDFTENWMSAIRSYLETEVKEWQFNFDYLLLDEGQDFKGEWVQFLRQYFLGSGELFVVYDKAQDIFGHGTWIKNEEERKEIGFKKAPVMLQYSHRLPDPIIQKIRAVRQHLNISEIDILKEPSLEQITLFQSAFWHNCEAATLTDKIKLIELHVEHLRQTNDWEDITILTTNENTGAEIVERFEAKDIKTSHVYDLARKKNPESRRAEKWRFQGGTGRLKVCSFQSYKGWQTPNILLVLDSPTTSYSKDSITNKGSNRQTIKDALFISMSRIKGKASSGEYSFTCLNYLSEYNDLQKYFDQLE